VLELKFLVCRCSSTCQLEKGFTCAQDAKLGYTKCVEICGDGINLGFLQCDDGNNVSGDGCSSKCLLEPGWNCVSTLGGKTICKPICGDKIVVSAEQCDDGNTISLDG
jgi:cysteine-rich repeat protein